MPPVVRGQQRDGRWGVLLHEHRAVGPDIWTGVARLDADRGPGPSMVEGGRRVGVLVGRGCLFEALVSGEGSGVSVLPGKVRGRGFTRRRVRVERHAPGVEVGGQCEAAVLFRGRGLPVERPPKQDLGGEGAAGLAELAGDGVELIQRGAVDPELPGEAVLLEQRLDANGRRHAVPE